MRKIFFAIFLLLCGLLFGQTQQKTIRYVIIISETSINQTILNGVMTEFIMDTSSNTVISTMLTNAADIASLKNYIDTYGNNMDGDYWMSALGIRHGFAWAILARYANDRNIDLDDTLRFINSVLYNGIQYIVLRIYK
jgi:hypothetical protein